MAISGGRFRINVTGARGGVTADLEALAATVQTTADNIQASASNIVPYAIATVDAPDSGRTRLSASYASPPLDTGDYIDLAVSQDISGPISLKTNKTGGGYLRVLAANNSELGIRAFPSGSVVRLVLNLQGVIWNVVSVTAAVDYVRNIGNDASGAKKAIQGIYGVPIALPIGEDVNFIGFNDFPAPSDNSTFEMLISANNTGRVFVYANGPTLRAAYNGTGADLNANDLVSGRIASFTRSDGGGGLAIYNGSRDLAQSDTIPVGSRDSDLTQYPWQTKNKVVVIPGSSNASPDYVANGSQPGQLIPAALNDAFPGSALTFSADVRAIAGTPWSDVGSQLGGSSAFTSGAATWVIPFFWMNDCRTVFYHDYGGVPAQFGAIIDGINYIRSKGAEPVLVTGFPPDPRASPSSSSKALDPNYFAENQSRGSAYSPSKAAPVSPTTDMVPAATDADFMVLRDWTGGGVARTGYKRIWHFNRTVREIAAERGCMVLDFEWATYRYCIEPIADLSAGLDTFYDVGNPLHPKAALYQQAVNPVVKQWARAMADGRDDIRVFRGV